METKKKPPFSWSTVWTGWLAFLVIAEIIGAKSKHAGKTLSENVRYWFPTWKWWLLPFGLLASLAPHVSPDAFTVIPVIIFGSGMAVRIGWVEWSRRSEMNFITKWFAKRAVSKEINKMEKSLLEPTKSPVSIPPLLRSIGVFALGLVAQASYQYIMVAASANWKDYLRYLLFSILLATAYWLKSGRPPTFEEVLSAMSPMNATITVKNDTPNDPIKLLVSGKEIPQSVVIAAITDPVEGPKVA